MPQTKFFKVKYVMRSKKKALSVPSVISEEKTYIFESSN